MSHLCNKYDTRVSRLSSKSEYQIATTNIGDKNATLRIIVCLVS